MTACGSSGDDGEHGYLLDDTTTTTAFTVELNTETLAPEQEEQVGNLADSLTGKLENKTIKWLSFYDPWHLTGLGNTKPVSVELFEKKYDGVIETYSTTWANQYSDLSTFILGGEVKRITVENPVRDIYGGLPTETANIISDAINQPLQGNDWYSVRDSVYDTVEVGVNDANDQIAKL